ncbi:hypothetical protein D3C87_1905610 [compost metagenome]
MFPGTPAFAIVSPPLNSGELVPVISWSASPSKLHILVPEVNVPLFSKSPFSIINGSFALPLKVTPASIVNLFLTVNVPPKIFLEPPPLNLKLAYVGSVETV